MYIYVMFGQPLIRLAELIFQASVTNSDAFCRIMSVLLMTPIRKLRERDASLAHRFELASLRK